MCKWLLRWNWGLIASILIVLAMVSGCVLGWVEYWNTGDERFIGDPIREKVGYVIKGHNVYAVYQDFMPTCADIYQPGCEKRP